MGLPLYINDSPSSFKRAVLNGTPEISFPFSERGDGASFELDTKWVVDHRYFQSLPLMSVWNSPYGKTYMVSEGKGSDVGGGLLESPRLFISLPKTRKEGQTVATALQFRSNDPAYDWSKPPADPEIAEFPISIPGYTKYEYFLTKPVPLIAKKQYLIWGKLFLVSDGIIPTGREYVVQDSDVHIYKGLIYERATIYGVWPF